MARGKKGAEFLARERDLIRPGFTSSCARLFSERGNPWLTEKELDRDFPRRRSSPASEAVPEHTKAAQIILARVRQKLGLATAYVPEPKPLHVVDPDFDAYFAERAKVKEPFADPAPLSAKRGELERQVSTIHRRVVGAIVASEAKRRPVEVRDRASRTPVIKGAFYRFDTDKAPAPVYKPRPLFGVPMKWKHKETDGHKHHFVESHSGDFICEHCGKGKDL